MYSHQELISTKCSNILQFNNKKWIYKLKRHAENCDYDAALNALDTVHCNHGKLSSTNLWKIKIEMHIDEMKYLQVDHKVWFD